MLVPSEESQLKVLGRLKQRNSSQVREREQEEGKREF